MTANTLLNCLPGKHFCQLNSSRYPGILPLRVPFIAFTFLFIWLHTLSCVWVGSCLWIDEVLGLVNHDMDVTNTAKVKVRLKLIRNNQRSWSYKVVYQAGYQDFIGSVGYSKGESPVASSFNHVENPCASVNLSSIVFAFMAKHRFIDLYSLSSTTQHDVSMLDFYGVDVSESLKCGGDCIKW